MLRKVNAEISHEGAEVAIRDAHFPAPFVSGLEYASPARGTWNIVHTGMLIPGAHEIFVCAASCLRGVVLTAAEMHAEGRFSTVEVRENNLLDGDMEELIMDGVSDIIENFQFVRQQYWFIQAVCIILQDVIWIWCTENLEKSIQILILQTAI